MGRFASLSSADVSFTPDNPLAPFFRPGQLLPNAARAIRRAGPAWLVVVASLILSILGIYAINVALPPAAGSVASSGFAALFDLGPAALKQVAFLGAGLAAAGIILFPHYRMIGMASWVLMAACLVLLVFLLIPFIPTSIVRPRNGARAWIDFGPIDLQPAEMAKIAYVVVLAWYLRFSKNHRTFQGLLPPAIITGVPVALIMLQPDWGTAMLFIPSLFAVLLAAGAKLKHLAIVVCIAALAAPAVYPLMLPHQKARIRGLVMQFRGEKSGDQDINMQSVTAQRMIGAGGVDGLGEERSETLLKFNALPERSTDMIFAVVGTRFGLMGSLLVLGLYAVWMVGALWTAAITPDPFGRLVIVGLTGFVAAQTFINVGMNVGLLPIVGITLPYLSYGGSSMVMAWLCTGLILSIAMRRPRPGLMRSFEWDE